jgi:fatty acid desaturase
MARRLLGSTNTLSTRTRVYLADDAIEVDEIEGYTGTRKRVLFDEVLLVTLDRRRRLSTLVASAALALLFMAAAGAATAANGTPGSIVAAVTMIISAPFWLWFLFHLFLGIDCVTVFGKRTQAQMNFALRKGRARSIFAQLCELVSQVQEAERRRLAGAGATTATPEGTAGAA